MRRLLARGQGGLDLLNLFIADAQTGFGAFLAVYLTAHKWDPGSIGLALSIGAVVSMASQIPAGLLVDRLRSKRLAVAGGVLSITLAALLFAALPYRLPVAFAEILHGFASCVITPALAAVSLRLVGHAGLGERLGRNARFGAIGSGTAAGIMGALGTYVSTQSVFLLTAALCLPALWALWRVGPAADVPVQAEGTAAKRRGAGWREGLGLLGDRRLVIFCGCILMFHLANAALLPIAASTITMRVGTYASLLIAVCIMLPQAAVALLSPFFGRMAGRYGRRGVLMIGWAALPTRALLFALAPTPAMIISAQVLDGVSGAVFGVMLPLIAADVTRGKGNFNLCIGIFGLAVGIGATLSTSLAGWVADIGGDRIAFVALAAAGLAGLALVTGAMPETAPEEAAASPKPAGGALPQIFDPAMQVPMRPMRPAHLRRPAGLRARHRRGYPRAMRGESAWR
jgi:MFS family permease